MKIKTVPILTPVRQGRAKPKSVYLPDNGIQEDIILIGGGRFNTGLIQVLNAFKKEIRESADLLRKAKTKKKAVNE